MRSCLSTILVTRSLQAHVHIAHNEGSKLYQPEQFERTVCVYFFTGLNFRGLQCKSAQYSQILFSRMLGTIRHGLPLSTRKTSRYLTKRRPYLYFLSNTKVTTEQGHCSASIFLQFCNTCSKYSQIKLFADGLPNYKNRKSFVL